MKVAESALRDEFSNHCLIITDGAYNAGTKLGGYGAILVARTSFEEIGCCVEETTSNRMEMTAVIHGLKNCLELKCDTAEILSDSEYVLKGLSTWSRKWVTQKFKNIKNEDLWLQMLDLAFQFEKVWCSHISGHKGIPANERCDEIAESFAREEFPQLKWGYVNNYAVNLHMLPRNWSKEFR